MNITAKQTGGNEKALFHDSYPSGFTVKQQYNSSGHPTVQTDASGRELYRTVGTTPMGQTERFMLGGVLESMLEYDTVRHLLAGMKTKKGSTTVQNLLFTYDAFCNLASRKDVLRNMEETFAYDDMDRLTEVGLNGVHSQVMTYDGYGRMTSKTAGGQAVFSGAVYDQTSKPHALDKAVTASGLFPSTPQTVSYTGFDKMGKVKMGSDSLVYTYGYGHQRIAMEEHVGNTVRTKRYVGACEHVTETMGSLTTDRWLIFLSGPTGVYAVVETENGTNTLHYILKDNLGSWTVVTDSDGNVEQRLGYDAWGNLRDPDTWSGSFTGAPMFDRGFTGHEHLHHFGLINMNGRVYDPVMSSFLSVDQYVQSPENSQNFNRYAYCLNNPLRYVDPTGWLPWNPSPGTPHTSDRDYHDIYAYVERAYEPRDLDWINLFDFSKTEQTALALGKITLTPLGENQYEIHFDKYDFNIEWDQRWSTRNIGTIISGYLHGPVFDNKPVPTHWMGGKPCYAQPSVYFGGPFDIHFSKSVYIRP